MGLESIVRVWKCDECSMFRVIKIDGGDDYSLDEMIEGMPLGWEGGSKRVLCGGCAECLRRRADKEALTGEEREMVAAGAVIEAIKSVRTRAKLTLKAAKKVVDRYRGLA